VQDPRGTLALYDQAFSLYQGDLLPADLLTDWLQVDRERLKSMHADMLHRAAGLAEAHAGADAAETYYERIFSLDPGSEQACRWLMARQAAAGRRNEAVRTYERCQLALQHDLDTEPEERTRRLYRSIIGG
jgi:DNA-binding SARP family transcriptional activator